MPKADSTNKILYRGNWATLLLPVNRDDSIDFGLLGAELDQFAKAKVSGVYSNGSAGEFYTQTESEFDRIQALLAEKCSKAGIAFQIGACHMSPQLSLERIKRTKALQPAGFQIILPDWFVPSWSEILAFLELMAETAAPIPLVLYNPPHAKRRLSPEEWQKIVVAAPAVAGIKVAGGDEAWYQAMQPVLKKISVFIPGHFLSTGISHGAHGAYSNVACLNPGKAQEWYELCLRDPAAGLKQQERILAFWQSQISPIITVLGRANMAADKAAAVAGGWLPGLSPRLRWPYGSVSEAEAAAIGKCAREMLPEFF